MATTCTIKSVTLQTGERYILGPNDTIIGSTDVEAISSECADLSNVESVSCYVAVLAGYNNSNGNTEYFEKQTQYVFGYELNGVFGSIPNQFNNNTQGAFYPGDIGIALRNAISSIVGSAAGLKFHTTNGENSLSYVVIKTFPSVGNNLKLVLNTDAPMGGGAQAVTYKVQFIPLQAAIDGGYENLPACP